MWNYYFIFPNIDKNEDLKIKLLIKLLYYKYAKIRNYQSRHIYSKTICCDGDEDGLGHPAVYFVFDV